MNTSRLGIRIAAALLLAALGGGRAIAMDLQISGSITQEIGVKITGKRNENNAANNPFNGVAEPYGGLPSSGQGGAANAPVESAPQQ